ncbi:type II CAAX endopeptidase family protein [Thermopolyspora sp. NPDC052614]|uniref:CPBP family intramembrane glutamic endopeptidase n=1 Tax=Thermopolyspora sp. NPDC052614 TaxID=3155682 RepID=UPI0034326D72
MTVHDNGGMHEPPSPGDPSPMTWGAQAPAPRVASAPPGTTYDRLARTPLHRWWRPLVGTLLVAVGFVVIGVVVLLVGAIAAMIVGIPLVTDGTSITRDPLFDLAVLLLSIALVLPVTYGVARLVQRRPPGTLSSVAGRLRWGWLWACMAVALVAVLLGHLATAAAFAVTGEGTDELFGWVGWGTFAPALVITLLLVPFQAATEEYIFRGWVLQAFGAYLRTPWPGIVLGSAGFTALHAYTGWGVLDVFVFGLVMGWISVRTGGLEAAIAIHTLNNVLAFLVSAASGDLDEALRQGAVPWQSLVGTAVQLTIFTVIVVILAKSRAIQTVSR